MPLSMIATSTVRFGGFPASSSRIAFSELIPAMLSPVWSRSCQFFGASSMTTAGTRVDGWVAAGRGVGAGVEAAGADAGAGAVVATVAGAEHAARANATRTSGDDFIRELIRKGILKDNGEAQKG